MSLRLTAAVLFCALSTACGTTRAVLLDTGQGTPLEYWPPSSNKSVAVHAEDFEEALAHLVLDGSLTIRSVQQGWLVRTSYPNTDSASQWQHLMRKSFGGLCRPGQPREDCLSLLDDVMGMSRTDKLVVALGLSIEPMRESIARAVENTLTPQFFVAAISAGMVTWAILAANPEPVFTKAAAIISAVMLIYLGMDAFLEVVKACVELKEASEQAVTFEELKDASQRFGEVLGDRGARIFILAVTVLVSRGTLGGASWLAARLPLLPHFAEASTLGSTQLGVKLAEVGQVHAVEVLAGKLVITLAPTAVAMVASGPGSGSAPPRAGRVSGEELAKLRREFEATKSRFWKNEASVNEGAYSPENLARMRSGKPPIGPDGHPMELHHKKSLAEGGSNSFDNLEIKTRTGHRLGDNYKKNHPNLP